MTIWPDGTLMAALTAKTRRDLLSLADSQRFERDAVLMRQGDGRGHVYLLCSEDPENAACVKITGTLRNGSESLLGIRVSGDLVGELAALLDTNRTATVTACATTLAHRIPNAVFLAFLHDHSEAWEALCRMIADRLNWSNRRRLDFAGYDIPVRLARVLLDLAERHGRPGIEGYELGVSLSQLEFGRLIGAKEDATQRAMRQLLANKLVTYTYRNVKIIDLQGLRAFADYFD